MYFYGGFGPVAKGAASGLVLFLGLLYCFMGASGFAAVIGLWLWRSWAIWLMCLIYLISIPLGIWDMLLNRNSVNVTIQLFNIGLDVWIIWYLMRTDTRGHFSQTRPPAA